MTEPEKQKQEEPKTVNVRLPAEVVEVLQNAAAADYRSLRDYCKVILIQHVEGLAAKQKKQTPPPHPIPREA